MYCKHSVNVFRGEKVLVTQSCLTLCNTMDCSPPGSSVHGILQAKILEWVAISFSRGASQPRDQPRSSSLPADPLPAEPQGKSTNTGVGSLSLLQWIFLAQESNQGLLHCRRILYQLSYQGIPYFPCNPYMANRRGNGGSSDRFPHLRL